jgi:choline dehydrogenase-like flavoprotein
MPLTFRYRELTLDNLDRLDLGQYVEDASDISVNTAHPQGGNPISRDPAKGVVNERLRVHGVRNLYICDASVFPTSIEVNPQLTVMALSHYAAQRIA